MSGLKDRISEWTASRCSQVPPLVPEHIRAHYAEEMARIPRVRVTVHRVASARSLPAVGSFYD